MDYSQALKYIYSFTNFEVTPAGTNSSKTFDLRRMEELLKLLGNPERRFRSIHVGGTKGKGSTAAMIENVLRTAGYKTGFYTSPHLHSFRERIRVKGDMIPKEDVVAGIERLAPLVAQVQGVTTFEVMTALAFGFFAAQGVEYAILEVGLGGRLDATNVVTPLVSVITSISYDHTGILGHTLTQIAREKAGIIKPHVPAVTHPQSEEAISVIKQVAQENSSPLVLVSPDLKFRVGIRDFQVLGESDSLESQALTLHTGAGTNLAVNLPLGGHHQLSNAATAIAAIEVLKEQRVIVSDEQLVQGLENVEWKGRMEIMQHAPLLVLDGAHNADSMHQLARSLRGARPNSRFHIIFGASSDKDIGGMFSEILPDAESLILTRSHNARAAEPAALEKLARAYTTRVSYASEIPSAIDQALAAAAPEDVIAVTGSLFVVAEAREFLLRKSGIQVEKD